jgi:hypothetical protein
MAKPRLKKEELEVVCYLLITRGKSCVLGNFRGAWGLPKSPVSFFVDKDIVDLSPDELRLLDERCQRRISHEEIPKGGHPQLYSQMRSQMLDQKQEAGWRSLVEAEAFLGLNIQLKSRLADFRYCFSGNILKPKKVLVYEAVTAGGHLCCNSDMNDVMRFSSLANEKLTKITKVIFRHLTEEDRSRFFRRKFRRNVERNTDFRRPHFASY